MPLNLVEKNKTYTIQRIAGKESVVHRLQELGFVPGTEVSVLSEINGNFLVGVKTIEQVYMLTKMGCDTFQGYYFSKPISVEEFEKQYMCLPEIQAV